jgi:lipopolysaccharide/colanic/teichoic acid biosynthesis glycosyltransferase
MTWVIELPSQACSMTDTLDMSPWNHSTGKRVFDLFLAIFALILSSPVLLLVALAVAVSSKGPIIYRQWRIGKGRRKFQLLKFRTMVDRPQQAGPNVTPAGDTRITAVGRLLRKWKLDELPQLFNVIRGDMSFVGPRPDVPEYLATLNSSQAQVLSLYPGLTGLATLKYRDEEQILAEVPSEQLEGFYCSKLLPEKVRIDLVYARSAGFMSDLGILLLTARAIFK